MPALVAAELLPPAQRAVFPLSCCTPAAYLCWAFGAEIDTSNPPLFLPALPLYTITPAEFCGDCSRARPPQDSFSCLYARRHEAELWDQLRSWLRTQLTDPQLADKLIPRPLETDVDSRTRLPMEHITASDYAGGTVSDWLQTWAMQHNRTIRMGVLGRSLIGAGLVNKRQIMAHLYKIVRGKPGEYRCLHKGIYAWLGTITDKLRAQSGVSESGLSGSGAASGSSPTASVPVVCNPVAEPPDSESADCSPECVRDWTISNN